MDVLNVSIFNSDGNVCLNDELLLELIQEQPFLYNALVRGYGDSDYISWAWARITRTFNARYENVTPKIKYTQAELQQRWIMLQPVIKGLGKVINVNDIPNSLWQTIVRISVQLEKSASNSRHKEFSYAQSIIHANIENVSKLPLERRKCLEAEVMDLILSSDIMSKGAIKLCPSKILQADEECERFMRGINEVTDPVKNTNSKSAQQLESTPEVDRTPTIHIKEEITKKSKTKDVPKTVGAFKPKLVVTGVNGEKVAKQFILPDKGDVKQESAAVSKSKASAPPPVANKSKASPTPPVVSKSQAPLSKLSGAVTKSEVPILPPPVSKSKVNQTIASRILRSKQFVPLRQAHLYTRKCRVVLTRCDMNEYIPLSKMKRERNQSRILH